jgi:hypothetical protein
MAVNNNIDRPTQTTQQESKRYCVTRSVTLFSLFRLLDARFPVLRLKHFVIVDHQVCQGLSILPALVMFGNRSKLS